MALIDYLPVKSSGSSQAVDLVKQNAAITTNGAYPLILAYSTDTTEVTNSVNKSSDLSYNPSTKALVTGGTVDGFALNNASAKDVDSSISAGSSSVNLPTSQAVASFVEGKGYTTTAPSSSLSLIAAAGSWSSATPPTQTITATGVTASNNIIVGIGSGATSEQIDAASSAKILCTAQGANSITLTCYGTEPSVNIPVSVMIVG